MSQSLKAVFRDFPSGIYSGVRNILISGEDSKGYDNQMFVIIYENENEVLNLEIRFANACTPFQQIEFINDLIIIGYQEHLYLYNLARSIVSQYKMDIYFCRIYCFENGFIVTSATNLLCFDSSANLKWTSQHLGIDGVIVKSIEHGIIVGEGEWDPPGAWKDFRISLESGDYIL
jgi:hypothetical protein